MAGGSRRVSVGFQGGQALALRITDKQLGELNKALPAGGWHEIETDEGPVRLNLGQVVYITADTAEPHVGFG